MITFNNIVERFEIFAENHFFIKTFSFGSPDDADLSKFTDFPLMHLVYTGANYDAGTKTYNIEVYILDVPADKNDKVERQKEVVSDAEQCAEDIIADIKNGGNIFLFAQDYEVVNATTTPLEEETKNVLSGVLLDLSVAIPYEWDACNAPIDGVEPGGTEVTYARRGVLRMLTIDGTTDVQSVRTINVTNGTLTDDGDGVVTLDTGGAETLNDLTDVDTTGVTDGQVLKYDNASGEWLPGNDQSATSLGNLDDVSIVTPANREALIYDGSEWVNDTVAKGDIGLGNVDNTSDADKPVSTATQTELNAKANTADVPTSLNDLSDVSIVGTPTGNQALIYDATANAFKSQVSYTNRFEDDVETGKQGITGTERAYSVKGEGDGVFIDPESDTPAAGKVIVRKIYHKAGFITDADVIGDYTLIHTFADDTSYADTVATFEGFEDGATYGVPPFTLLQTWEEVAAAPTFTGLLNESYGSGAAAAYGTRRLNGNYSGACMTIRRASDGTTQAIGFVGEEIDESAITTFCTGTTCTVQTWHDQSQTGGTGSGNDAEQTTAANQPTIYTGGALVKEGGRLGLQFASDKLGEFSISLNQPFTSTSVFKLTGTPSFSPIFGSRDGTGVKGSFVARTTNWWMQSTTLADTGQAHDNNQHLFYSVWNGSNSKFGQDGSALTTLNAGTTDWTNLAINSRGTDSAASGQDGIWQELIIWGSDKSTDRTSIEGNISAYYQSAKLLDESFGSGAEAAYSTRQLRRDQTDCMVIRRASDSTTQTIGFDASGNIDEAAINTFCSGTSCTVYQWLDQSGNGNTATAPSTGEEPTIYTGGALVKDGGRVAMTSTGSTSFDFTRISDINSVFSVLRPTDFTTTRNSFILGDTVNSDYHSDYNGGWLGNNSATVVRNGANYLNGSSVTLTGLTRSAGQYVLSMIHTANTARANTISQDRNAQYGQDSWIGNRQELIIYSDDRTNDRAQIESNVGDYFTQNTPLLDTYSGAAAAYSLRKLSSSYSGSAIRVRRSSDNTEQDINFNVFGELDTVSLLDFAGAGDAFCKVWYDQSGNANDATQTTTANQPKIVSSGAVEVESGKPAITRNASNALGFDVNANITSTTEFSVFALYEAQGDNRPFSFNAGYAGSNSGNPRMYQGNFIQAATTYTQPAIHSYLFASPDKCYMNGVERLSGDAGSNAITQISVLGGSTATFRQALYMQEVVYYASDQSSNRTNIESNINTFYSIY